MQLAAGEVVLTSTGRATSPFPYFNLRTERAAARSIRAVDLWLMSNALAEAQARGDSFNAGWLGANQARPSQADKDCAELYLFTRP